MTTEEFSNAFDTFVSSYSHKAEFGNQASSADIVFDEYEKSLFLTKSQEEIVKELYSGRYTGDSFESNEQLRRELEDLVQQEDCIQCTSKCLKDNYKHTIYTLPKELLYIVYEQVQWEKSTPCISGLIADVYPTTHDEYWRITNNPFRGPNNRRVLRLDKGNGEVELVSNNNIGTYTIRYLRKPEPIVLVTSEDAPFTYEGKTITTPQTCKLDESLHKIILDRAVRYALASKYINNNTKDNGE